LVELFAAAFAAATVLEIGTGHGIDGLGHRVRNEVNHVAGTAKFTSGGRCIAKSRFDAHP
jgi:hypothetical protein